VTKVPLAQQTGNADSIAVARILTVPERQEILKLRGCPSVYRAIVEKNIKGKLEKEILFYSSREYYDADLSSIKPGDQVLMFLEVVPSRWSARIRSWFMPHYRWLIPPRCVSNLANLVIPPYEEGMFRILEDAASRESLTLKRQIALSRDQPLPDSMPRKRMKCASNTCDGYYLLATMDDFLRALPLAGVSN